jgi:hypothetical protein
MELESIFWARLRVLKTQTTSHDGRISTLEDRSIQSSPTSADHWERISSMAEIATKIVGLLKLLYHMWPLLALAAAAIWTLLLPGLRWLWRVLSSGLAWLAGLGVVG